MKGRLSYILILLVFPFVLKGQEDQTTGPEEPFITIPDTFYFYTPEIQLVPSLDSIKGKVFDSITEPKAWFIDTWIPNDPGSGGYGLKIALETKNGFLVFDAWEQSLAYASADNVILERVDLDGKGNKELLLRWEFYAGHTGWEHSIHERIRGIQVWNLDTRSRMFDFQNYYDKQEWWTVFAPDTTENLPYEEREALEGGEDYHTEHFDVEVGKKQIIISVIENEGGLDLPSDTMVYLLRKRCFARVKD